MTPAPLTRPCLACAPGPWGPRGWCPACEGRGVLPATAQCVPGTPPPAPWACVTRGPWCEQFADHYREQFADHYCDSRFHPCGMTLLRGRIVRRPWCAAGDYPCTVTP